MRSVGIKKEKKKNGLQLTESVLSALEELVSVACGERDVAKFECSRQSPEPRVRRAPGRG